jgi:hypothetical protein
VITVTYKVDGALQSTSLVAVLTATSDTDYEVDVTGDRAWVATDFPLIVVTLAATTLGAANAEVDAIYISTIEVEVDINARVTYSWLGEAP